jgi:hypothetical protein
VPEVNQIDIGVDLTGNVLRRIVHGESIRFARLGFKEHAEVEVAVAARSPSSPRTEDHQRLHAAPRHAALESVPHAPC